MGFIFIRSWRLIMLILRVSFFFFLFSICLSEKVLDYKKNQYFESDFYSYFPKTEWQNLNDNSKREEIFNGFVKQVASVYEAVSLGLDLDPEIEKKIAGRYNRLLVNEYYMRDFLGSVIPNGALYFCRKNLNKEVFVKHILVDSLSFAVELVDSIKAGKPFSDIASSYSKDPSVEKNLGSLGWISLGQTVPKFQDHIFTSCVGCVEVVGTDFGFHVVAVDSVRASSYSLLDVEEYDDYAFRFATGYISSPLKDLASKHDSLLLGDVGFYINKPVVVSFLDSVSYAVQSSENKSRSSVDFLAILNSFSGVFFEYKEELYGGAWLANKFSDSFYSNVFFDDYEVFVREVSLLVLRDAVSLIALDNGVQEGSAFIKQFGNIKRELLEKEYIKNLISSVPFPSKEEVESYYYKNESEKFTNKSTGKPFGLKNSFSSVETILLKEKQDKIKSDFYISLKNEDVVKVNKVWLYVD